MSVRKDLVPIIEKNKKRESQTEPYAIMNTNYSSKAVSSINSLESLNHIMEIREHDVPYLQRVCIDKGFRAGLWYKVEVRDGDVHFSHQKEMLELPPVTILAFDIETTKAPLKFPNSEYDLIMMISYMINDEGFLIVNREIVSEDIENFEYTPKPEFKGNFHVFNVANEKDVLTTFFTHIRKAKPVIYVTYNGDFFDWPFIDARSQHYGMNLSKEIGVWKSNEEYKGRFVVHLDAFCWVKRDSYLPQGSQGLKAVTKVKLNYDPLELDPEDMLPFASENPQLLASYSVSDAVATFYLYTKYVHSFIFSLSMIIPMTPGDVLRKGSGTLCEQLLMVRAFEKSIICPNKKTNEFPSFHKNFLLDSETYIGGHVECLESGIFRSDVKYSFDLNPVYLQELIDGVEDAIRFCVDGEFKKDLQSLKNLDSVKQAIIEKLEQLRDSPKRDSFPLIYHLDVGAMYPNIILTNRLQPMAIVSQRTCASCDFNIRGEECQRKMDWTWRGKRYPISRAEFNSIKSQVEAEQLSKTSYEQVDMEALIMKRVKEYSQKVYKKVYIEEVDNRTDTVCQRENSFYVDTVRDFRDRRYEYKDLKKKWAKAVGKAVDSLELQKCKNLEQLYDSLQLAHKCILNSFYGYVMRKGARWSSMEMAGIVTYTGANIIKDSRIIVEKIGRALELDTDGIWCMLPSEFPENFELLFNEPDGKESKLTLSYPCTILNQMVHQNYCNPQYLNLTDSQTRTYSSSTENTIYFEVDGPYKAMVLPAAQEEGKSLKKRYAVFDHKGNIVELKGFELKRRGELKLIKIFQAEVFPAFLKGKSLKETYDSVAEVANRWLDVLENEGADLEDEDLFDLLSESRVMSQSLKDYEGAKSTSITAATRLADFLGQEMVKDKGLNCRYVISKWPQSDSVSSRAIPTVIFSAEPAIQLQYIRKWTGRSDLSIADFDVRNILDWSYYTNRLGSAVQKIITIPAALQNISNPVPRVVHPDWVSRIVCERHGRLKQRQLGSFFAKKTDDIEDLFSPESLSNSKKRSNEQANSITILTGNEDLVDQEPPSDADEGAPVTMEEDFDSWLVQQKKFWKDLRSKKSRHSEMEATGAKRKQSKKSKMTTATTSFLKEEWTILQIVPSPSIENCVRLWVVSRGALRCVDVAHKPCYYVNSTDELDFLGRGQRVQKFLPRGKRCLNLYEWFPNGSSQQIRQQEEDLLANPKVKGVYETHIDPAFDLVIRLGNACSTQRSVPLKSLERTKRASSTSDFGSDILTSSNSSTYVDISTMKVHFLYISRSGMDSKESRAVVTFFLDQGHGSYEIHFLLSNSHKNRVERPNTEAIFRSQTNLDISKLKFKFEQFTSLDGAFLHLNSLLHKHSVLSGDTPELVLCQSNLQVTDICQRIPSLYSRFPFAVLPYPPEDEIFPTLNWGQEINKRAANRFVQSFFWLDKACKICQYSRIPLGNLFGDAESRALDVQFCRTLRSSQHLLWSSSPGQILVDGSLESENHFEADVVNPEILFPGCYRTPCFELSIDNFASNTILLYHVLQTVEGSSGEAISLDNADQFDGLEVDITFKILRLMVQNLFQDVIQSRNEDADSLLQHFFRWIKSSSSQLHDPLLFRMLHRVMCKMFLRLCAQFKEHGAPIVYASFSKIIINTSKPFLENAISFMKYVVESILSNELFAYITIEFNRLWESLIFLDQANYQGIEYTMADAVIDEVQMSTNTTSVEDRIVGSWSISEFLPEAAKEYFISFAFDFLRRPYEFQKQLIETSQERVRLDVDKVLTEVQSFTSKMLTQDLIQRALEVVEWMKHNMRDDEVDENRFPILPGSHLELKDPALEFVKLLVHIFSLDHSCADETQIMRNSLLKLLGVRPFSPDAQFADPCRVVILPEVICDNCNQSRDLDLCRDPQIVSNDWSCPVCGTQPDILHIESLLVKKLQKQILRYQVQDLSCLTCKRTKTDNLQLFCKCSGRFEPTISQGSMNTE